MEKFLNKTTDIILLVLMILVVSSMALILPGMITQAGFTGAAAYIVAMIPMMIPISVIVVAVMDLVESFKGMV